MNDEASNAVAASHDEALHWPTPPFFGAAPVPAYAHARDCVVELVNGRILSAELLGFDPDTGGITVAVAGEATAHHLGLDSVRTLRLRWPLQMVRDEGAIHAVGGETAPAAEERPFAVRFHDGTTLTGHTLGFVRDAHGLFLYMTNGGPQQVQRCFIPTQQIDEVQIGPLLGETLAHSGVVSNEVLAAALDKQARMREQKLGEQFVDHGIVAPEELKQALQMQKRRPSMKLGDILMETGFISPGQLTVALGFQANNRQRRLGDILIEMGAVTMRQVQMAMSQKLGIPFVDAGLFRLNPLALELVTPSFAFRHQVLALLRLGESLVVAVENPLAMDFAQELRFLTKLTIVPVIANPKELRARIAREYAHIEPVETAGGHDGGDAQIREGQRGADLVRVNVEDLTSELARQASSSRQTTEESEPEPRVTDNTLVRLVNKIIMDAHAQGASDIHIESNIGNTSTRIRFRKDGDLEDYLELQPAYRSALVSRIKIMAGLDISEHRHSQDGKIAFSRFGGVPIELRVVIVPTANNLEDVVLRILGGTEPLPLDKLGFSERDLGELTRMVSRSYGLILVCGPTGSGKTTTLHSVLHHINRPDLKIWTAEDPVEITQPGLRQVQIHAGIGWTFAAAMRTFLRADPDVIMVGEMRDVETTKIGIEASLTGHLVFSTLHTNSAAESVVRLLDLGMDPFNFADALIGILSQRLARKLCTRCRKAHVAEDKELQVLAQEYCAGTKLDPATVVARWHETYTRDGQLLLHEAVGCEACTGGYKGRIGVYELLSGTPHVKDLIRARGSVPLVQEAAMEGGMRLLHQDAIEKALSGVIDLASARAASS
ncbi:MAG: ATPase, T2SS/T4P/T4SS family [Sinimarinibacterium sp.]|jgi:type II secretory ATPase GspE/PulE/Tfp pilus assembly ATPase PilB-like protein